MERPLELARPSLLFFEPRSVNAAEKQAGARVKADARKEKRLFCALCRHPITHQDERIPVNGANEHTCTNPGGYTFSICCFREAGGCIAVGAATAAHTWFPGYAWRIALCASCEQHLGWRFQAPSDYFHGLISNRLTSVARGS